MSQIEALRCAAPWPGSSALSEILALRCAAPWLGSSALLQALALKCAAPWPGSSAFTDPGPEMRCALAREQRIGDKICDISMRCALAREKRFIHRSGPVPPARGSIHTVLWLGCAGKFTGHSGLLGTKIVIYALRPGQGEALCHFRIPADCALRTWVALVAHGRR